LAKGDNTLFYGVEKFFLSFLFPHISKISLYYSLIGASSIFIEPLSK